MTAQHYVHGEQHVGWVHVQAQRGGRHAQLATASSDTGTMSHLYVGLVGLYVGLVGLCLWCGVVCVRVCVCVCVCACACQRTGSTAAAQELVAGRRVQLSRVRATFRHQTTASSTRHTPVRRARGAVRWRRRTVRGAGGAVSWAGRAVHRACGAVRWRRRTVRGAGWAVRGACRAVAWACRAVAWAGRAVARARRAVAGTGWAVPGARGTAHTQLDADRQQRSSAIHRPTFGQLAWAGRRRACTNGCSVQLGARRQVHTLHVACAGQRCGVTPLRPPPPPHAHTHTCTPGWLGCSLGWSGCTSGWWGCRPGLSGCRRGWSGCTTPRCRHQATWARQPATWTTHARG
jgi:hypothetical protein